jgi:hypothetical protein
MRAGRTWKENGTTPRYLTNPLAIRVPEAQIGALPYLLNLHKLIETQEYVFGCICIWVVKFWN